MVSREVNNGFLIRLEKGELIHEQLKAFCSENNITAGWISGIGGALWAEIAFYHLDEKAYEFDRIDELLEIACLTGNVALDKDEVTIHIHAVVADENSHSYSGHLKEAAVAGTCEIYLHVFDEPIEREHSEEIGLKLMSL